jgi:hypothetical protein
MEFRYQMDPGGLRAELARNIALSFLCGSHEQEFHTVTL